MVKVLTALLLITGWINASAAEIDSISYESLIPAGSPCDTTSRERDRITQPVARVANFVMVVSNKGHCEHHMSFKEVDAIASELISECEWVRGDPAFGCHVVMVNEKWMARASDFRYLAPARIRWNKRTHANKAIQTMTLNQRAKLLVRAQIDHNLAFGNFDFTAPLSKDEIPTHGVVELTQYGRQVEPLLDNPWQSQDRDQIVQRLAKSPNAIFVAPVQTIGYGFNAAHRKAISLKLARQIQRTTGRHVHDPLLIQRAFGQGLRSVPVPQLVDMAAQVGADIVVIPQVGHDNDNDLVFRTRIVRVAAGSRKLTTPKSLEGRRSFGSTDNLVAAFATYGTRIGNFLTRKNRLAGARKASNRAQSNRRDNLIPSADELLRNEWSALKAIVQYQWLGGLVPESHPELRSELYARSLVLLSESGTLDDPTERLLTARALAEMSALPAARSILRSDQRNSAFSAYRAFSLGRFQAMQSALEAMNPSVAKDLLLTDQIRLLASIGQTESYWAQIEMLAKRYPEWEAVLRRDISAQPLSQDWQHCEPNAQFCPNQAFALVRNALVVDSVVQSVYNPTDSGTSLLDKTAQLDTELLGHPVYEQAVLIASAREVRNQTEPAQQSQLLERVAVAQNYLRTGLEFSDSELLQPGKTYPVVMFPAHKYRRANDQDYPPEFANGRAFQYSRYSQGPGLIDYFFFRMPGQRLAPGSTRVNASR